MTDSETVIRQMWAAINARDYPRVAGAIAERCEWVSVPGEHMYIGPTAMVNGLRAFAATFPDGRSEIEKLYVSGDTVIIEWRTSGTNAAGSSFTRRGCAVAEMHGGKIVAYRDYFDRQSLADQLSAATAASAPTAAPAEHRPRHPD